jgi:hypothetical protein
MSNPTTPFGWQMPTATDLVTDLPADFEVFGQAVATSMGDLLGGTSGQILAKNSNTDMDFVWIANDQGDITGVTATTPLTGGGTSGAITVGIQDALTTQKGAVQLSDSTSTTSSILAATPTAVKSAYDLANTANTTANAAVPKSTVTTAGDVIYGTGSSAVTRLGIGTAGQVLTVNGGATAPSWATPSSGGMTSLASGSLSGASVVLSSISGSYTHLQLAISNFQPATNNATFFIRVNGDSAANRYFAGTVGSAIFTFNSTGWQVSPGQQNSTNNGTIIIDLFNYTKTTGYKLANGIALTYDSANGDSYLNSTLAYNQAAAINSLTMLPSGGNFTGGTYTLWGVK